MNKKILVIVAAMMVLSITFTPLALAKPGQKTDDKKLDFVLSMEGPIVSTDDDNTRKWESGDKLTHARGAPWIAAYLEVTLGSEVISADYLSYEVELASNFLLGVRLHVQAKETVYIWKDIAKTELRGYIELNTNDNFFLADPSSGTFSGHGMVDDQKVKVSGVSTGYVIPPTRFLTRAGTIMGLAP